MSPSSAVCRPWCINTPSRLWLCRASSSCQKLVCNRPNSNFNGPVGHIMNIFVSFAEDPVLGLDVIDVPMLEVQSSPSALLTQGAACNVLYLGSTNTEALTGPQAVRKAMSFLMTRRPLPEPTVVHFKVSSQGITLTDNARK